MRTEKINGHKVEIYDSIDELPIVRFQQYNKMMLVDSGIGSDLSDIDIRISRTIAYIMQKEPKSAIKEMENLRQTIYFIHEGISPKNLAFAALVKSIDGKETNDISCLLEEKKGIMDSIIESIKKKIQQDLTLYFPEVFESAMEKEFCDKLRRKTLMSLKRIQGEKIIEADFERLSNEIVTFSRVMNFQGKESAEISTDKEFETLCLLISKHTGRNAKEMTALEFYNAYEFIKNGPN